MPPTLPAPELDLRTTADPAPPAPPAPRVAPERWLTLRQAQTLLQVSRRTLYNWIGQGKLVVRRTPGGRLRVAEGSLWQEQPPRQEQR